MPIHFPHFITYYQCVQFQCPPNEAQASIACSARSLDLNKYNSDPACSTLGRHSTLFELNEIRTRSKINVRILLVTGIVSRFFPYTDSIHRKKMNEYLSESSWPVRSRVHFLQRTCLRRWLCDVRVSEKKNCVIPCMRTKMIYQWNVDEADTASELYMGYWVP